MQRKDERAIRYWTKGRLDKPTSTALRLNQSQMFLGGELVAVKRKTLAGLTIIYVTAGWKNEIDFGCRDNPDYLVVGKHHGDLVETRNRFVQFDRLRKSTSISDLLSLSNSISAMQKITGTSRHEFVQEGDSVLLALAMIPHDYTALARMEAGMGFAVQDIDVSRYGGRALTVRDALFRRFEDAIVLKMKYSGVKVFAL